MRLPRKLKKKLIRIFGRSTYYCIKNGHIKVVKYNNGHGVRTKYTYKFQKIRQYYHEGQCNPYLTLPNIN